MQQKIYEGVIAKDSSWEIVNNVSNFRSLILVNLRKLFIMCCSKVSKDKKMAGKISQDAFLLSPLMLAALRWAKRTLVSHPFAACNHCSHYNINLN